MSVVIAGSLRIDNTEGVRAAALNGLGIAFVPVLNFVNGQVESGLFEIVLTGFASLPGPITAVWPQRRMLSSKVRAAIEFFAAEFRLEPRLGGAIG